MFIICMIPVLFIYTLHVHADSCLEEIHDLRKIVQENTGMIRAFRETVNIQERRIQHLETRLAKSEDEKLNLVRRLEILENLDFEVEENLKVEHATQETRSPESIGTKDVETRKVQSSKEVLRKQSARVFKAVKNQELENQDLGTQLVNSEDKIPKRRLENRKNLNSKPQSIKCPKEASPPQDNDTTNIKVQQAKEVPKSVSQRASPGVVVFYAYMSHDETNPGPHHTIIFDVPITNVGNGYNRFSGTFSVPSSGVYVFSWTITCSPYGFVYSQLVANDFVVGSILTYGDQDWISTTGLVVKEVNEGDMVYVRTAPSDGPSGNIMSSSTHKRTSFSGWKLQ